MVCSSHRQQNPDPRTIIRWCQKGGTRAGSFDAAEAAVFVRKIRGLTGRRRFIWMKVRGLAETGADLVSLLRSFQIELDEPLCGDVNSRYDERGSLRCVTRSLSEFLASANGAMRDIASPSVRRVPRGSGDLSDCAAGERRRRPRFSASHLVKGRHLLSHPVDTCLSTT
jgi:hypothetical protein